MIQFIASQIASIHLTFCGRYFILLSLQLDFENVKYKTKPCKTYNRKSRFKEEKCKLYYLIVNFSTTINNKIIARDPIWCSLYILDDWVIESELLANTWSRNNKLIMHFIWVFWLLSLKLTLVLMAFGIFSPLRVSSF